MTLDIPLHSSTSLLQSLSAWTWTYGKEPRNFRVAKKGSREAGRSWWRRCLVGDWTAREVSNRYLIVGIKSKSGLWSRSRRRCLCLGWRFSLGWCEWLGHFQGWVSWGTKLVSAMKRENACSNYNVHVTSEPRTRTVLLCLHQSAFHTSHWRQINFELENFAIEQECKR